MSGIFNDSKSLFRQRINTVVERDSCEKIINDLFILNSLRKNNLDSKKLTELYKLLGPELFADVVAIIDGETVKFPTIEQFKDDMNICISYYLKYMQGCSWDEIKESLNCGSETVKYGINCSKLDAFIKDGVLNGKDGEAFDKLSIAVNGEPTDSVLNAKIDNVDEFVQSTLSNAKFKDSVETSLIDDMKD